MSAQSEPLEPTFEGHVATTWDALVLFEACLSGHLSHVPRRPHDRERPDLIKSGHVFIYEEHSSGIKRWTDGVSWSPSRILGNFLIYRELEKPFPPGEKKRALKKSKKCPTAGVSKPEPSPRSASISYPTGWENRPSVGEEMAKEAERSLIGSLVDSYPFKQNGLVKKTISISYQGIPHHLVSYYSLDDVKEHRLAVPSKHESTSHIDPRADLYMAQNFRSPIREYDLDDQEDRVGHPVMYASIAGAHELIGNGGHIQRTMSLPTLSLPNFQPTQIQGYTNTPPYGFAHQAQPSPFIQPVTSNTSSMSTAPPMSYAAPSQGNYALDPSRTPRFNSTASLGHDFPRNMPTDHSPQRRHSTFEAPVPSELSTMSLGSIPETRPMTGNNAYPSAQPYYLPHRGGPLPTHETFPSPRQMKAEPELGGDDPTSQSYGLDEGNSTWLESLENGEHQFFGNNTIGDSQHWASNSSSIGRT